MSRLFSGLRRTARVAAFTTVAFAAGAAAGAAWFRYEFGPDALPRLVKVYAVAAPATWDYRKLQFMRGALPEWLGIPVDKAATAADFEALHRKWAPRLLDAVLELRGFYLKGGQLVASNYGNAMARIWTKTFERVLDQQPPHDFEREILPTLKRELRVEDLSLVFSSFEREPIAAGSIGQVHRAVLREGGRPVVVKVQYDAVEACFRGDVTVTKFFYKLVLPDQAPILEEVERQFASEFDYRREAEQLALVRANTAAAGRFTDVVVPAPIPSLCTKGVLVMEEVTGAVKLTTALEDDLSHLAAARGVSLEALLEEEERLRARAAAEGKSRHGPDAAHMDALIARIHARNNWGAWLGLQPVHVPLNHARLVDELLAVHGHHVLVDGAFSGDPHPGNLLVQRKPDGDFARLALIDFGQVKRLTPQQRAQLARLIAALARADPSNAAHRARVAQLSWEMGLRTEKGDPDFAYKYYTLLFDRDDPEALPLGLNAQEYLEALSRVDRLINPGDDFVMAFRCNVMLRGLGHMLGQHRSVAHAWRPIADEVLRAAGEDPDALLK